MPGKDVNTYQTAFIICNPDLPFLLAGISVLQKHSKCERMSGCNYCFMIEKGQFIEWMAATSLAN